MMDIDGDGRLDVISGSYFGDVFLFRGLPGGKFSARETIVGKNGKPFRVAKGMNGYAAATCAVDWDADGDVDLVVGNIHGDVFLVRNVGTSKTYEFAGAEKLSAGGEPIRVDGDSGPTVADWDGDGKLDLVVGDGHGSVTWFRNIGTAAEPNLARGERLVDGRGWGFDEDSRTEGPGVRAKPCVVDWNGDGRVDLLVGDFSEEHAKPRAATPKEQEAEAEARREYDAASKKYDAASAKTDLERLYDRLEKLDSPPDDETDAAEKSRETQLEEVRRKIADIDRDLEPLRNAMNAAWKKVPEGNRKTHGFVWFYERTAPDAGDAEVAGASEERFTKTTVIGGRTVIMSGTRENPPAIQLEAGKAPGTFHYSWTGRVAWSAEPAWPANVGFRLLTEMHLTSPVRVDRDQPITIVANLRPGTYYVESHLADNWPPKRYWDAIGPSITIDDSGKATLHEQELRHDLYMDVTSPKTMEIVDSLRPVLRFTPLAGAVSYSVGLIEENLFTHEVLDNSGGKRTSTPEFTPESDLVSGRLYEVYLTALDAAGKQLGHGGGYFITKKGP
ncbi:MAG: VCBS repeat-containing protein [Planctomycetes bacterium]|nr:VCBS repeat-containing protein [Planctomycetota bacterium]